MDEVTAEEMQAMIEASLKDEFEDFVGGVYVSECQCGGTCPCNTSVPFEGIDVDPEDDDPWVVAPDDRLWSLCQSRHRYIRELHKVEQEILEIVAGRYGYGD